MNDAVHQSPPIAALDVPANARRSNYPEPFASRMEGRVKRALGAVFELTSLAQTSPCWNLAPFPPFTTSTADRTNSYTYWRAN